jgi:toxin FitB
VTDWLLDTNVLSELRRPKPDRRVLTFVAGHPIERLHVSTVTLAEIRFGIERLDDPSKRLELNEWLTHKVRPLFAQRVLPVSEDVMFRWRVLVEEGRTRGHTFSQNIQSSNSSGEELPDRFGANDPRPAGPRDAGILA